MNIDRPTVLLDKNRCRKNIERMAGKLKQLGLSYRPHFKTHQSAEIGNWYREFGITAITVSSPAMASYFMENGWKNITIAFPMTPLQFPIIHDLAENSDLTIFLNDPVSARFFAEKTTRGMSVFIEIDAGLNRSGVPIENIELVNELHGIIKKSKALRFHGFYVHEGRTYRAKGKKSVERMINPVLAGLQELKTRFDDCKICIGDTPSCSLLETFPGIDEMSPGNNVFYDFMQANIGSCTTTEIAVAVACPVAQIKKEADEVVLHGGAVHFSKERMNWKNQEIYGVPVELNKDGFGDLLPDGYLKGMSQEHGILSGNPDWISGLQPGDTVCIFPVHSCLTVNLFGNYRTLEGDRIEKRILS